MDIQRLLFVGIGSFIGGAARYAVSTWTARTLGAFPLGTLLVNLIGGLLIGFIMQAGTTFWPISAETRLFLTTGVMGGLTTFSTFSYESIRFFSEGQYAMLAANVCLNLFLSLFACWLGGTLARAMA